MGGSGIGIWDAAEAEAVDCRLHGHTGKCTTLGQALRALGHDDRDWPPVPAQGRPGRSYRKRRAQHEPVDLV